MGTAADDEAGRPQVEVGAGLVAEVGNGTLGAGVVALRSRAATRPSGRRVRPPRRKACRARCTSARWLIDPDSWAAAAGARTVGSPATATPVALIWSAVGG